MDLIMKKRDIKFAVYLALLTIGLIFLAVSNRWLFFTGFMLVMFSGLFTFHYKARALSILSHIIYVGVLLFIMWSFGFEKPSAIYLAVIWLILIGREFHYWRKNRKCA